MCVSIVLASVCDITIEPTVFYRYQIRATQQYYWRKGEGGEIPGPVCVCVCVCVCVFPSMCDNNNTPDSLLYKDYILNM